MLTMVIALPSKDEQSHMQTMEERIEDQLPGRELRLPE